MNGERFTSGCGCRRAIVIAVAAAVVLSLVATSGASAARGTLRVKLHGAHGRDVSQATVCLTRPKHPQRTVGRCLQLNKHGVARFRRKAGRYLIALPSDEGFYRCYGGPADGYHPSKCTRVRIRAGRVKTIRWTI